MSEWLTTGTQAEREERLALRLRLALQAAYPPLEPYSNHPHVQQLPDSKNPGQFFVQLHDGHWYEVNVKDKGEARPRNAVKPY